MWRAKTKKLKKLKGTGGDSRREEEKNCGFFSRRRGVCGDLGLKTNSKTMNYDDGDKICELMTTMTVAFADLSRNRDVFTRSFIGTYCVRELPILVLARAVVVRRRRRTGFLRAILCACVRARARVCECVGVTASVRV